MKKRIALFGSTGVVGKAVLDVVRHFSSEFEITVLAAKTNIDLLYIQALEFNPKYIVVYEESFAALLRAKLPSTVILSGIEGLQLGASFDCVDFVMLAMSGTLGLFPAISAIHAGKVIGIANKEVLVSAGELISNLVREKKVTMLPVDGEHAAIDQCLRGKSVQAVRRLILTASGGPFWQKGQEELDHVSLEGALQHPHLKMGAKTMVDCSTLMNKGLEVIEARFLFDIPSSSIEAMIHPQSLVQSCVEFVDGSVLALLAEPNMMLPIQYALTFPKQQPGPIASYDFFKNAHLTFHPIDTEKFPCFRLALEALRYGRSYPCFLNGANEVLVERFLRKEISWKQIGSKLEKLISSHKPENVLALEAILEVDRSARSQAMRA